VFKKIGLLDVKEEVEDDNSKVGDTYIQNIYNNLRVIREQLP
jgi:ABC-type Zn uptake system ZnuABC Zn-binding protein ZnuA